MNCFLTISLVLSACILVNALEQSGERSALSSYFPAYLDDDTEDVNPVALKYYGYINPNDQQLTKRGDYILLLCPKSSLPLNVPSLESFSGTEVS
uniref:Ephrin RBD domain-containing protein n=1 Tax=Syphacia muris TaxID=451379 RepID=A0A0N5B0Y2_9BILA